MTDADAPDAIARTAPADGIWYSLSPPLIPPDDQPGWLDLHRHSDDGVIILGRFPDPAAAHAWAAAHLGLPPEAWEVMGDG